VAEERSVLRGWLIAKTGGGAEVPIRTLSHELRMVARTPRRVQMLDRSAGIEAIRARWSAGTCAEDDRQEDNPSKGQCEPSSFVAWQPGWRPRRRQGSARTAHFTHTESRPGQLAPRHTPAQAAHPIFASAVNDRSRMMVALRAACWTAGPAAARRKRSGWSVVLGRDHRSGTFSVVQSGR
jgi:hypothetical protein